LINGKSVNGALFCKQKVPGVPMRPALLPKKSIQALTEVSLFGPQAFADLRVSAEADTRHEVPRKDDFNRPE